MTDVIAEIAAERRRQIEAEGWTAEHDDRHNDGSLARAASCYADPDPQMVTDGWPGGQKPRPVRWPLSWGFGWWKPKDRRRDLIRAAALIVAEIERLDRRNPPSPHPLILLGNSARLPHRFPPSPRLPRRTGDQGDE